MSPEKKKIEKSRLHSRNKNRDKYDLSALTICNPELKKHIVPNRSGGDSIDFSNPLAVKVLNRALLNHYYGIENWEFPDENLCPPIPGRADYIHHIADILAENNFGKIPTGENVICLDVGLGASCIYPIVGVTEYDWTFIGSDIDPNAIASAQNIIDSNASLKNRVECRLQKNSSDVFYRHCQQRRKNRIDNLQPSFSRVNRRGSKREQKKSKKSLGEKRKITQT